MSTNESRYELVSRRAMLKRTLLVGGLAFAPGLACSKSDKEAFSTNTGASATGSTAASTTTAAKATGATGTTTTAKATGATTTAAPATGGATLPANAQLAIKFTYTASGTTAGGPGGGGGGGRVNNPYIAVWIEDAAGALVRTVSLWYKSSEAKYVNELQRWYTVDRARIAKGGADTMRTISSATRVPGAYSLAWDGKNDAGALVPLGNYFVCIEAAREHGPHELIREAITLGDKAFEKALPDNGELTAASAALVV